MKKTLGTMVAIMVVAILIGTFIVAKNATAGETGKDGRFIVYDNGTVLDTKTKLMWAAKDNGSDINWAKAKSYCEKYRGGRYTDWRMPTLDELEGLDNSKTKWIKLTGVFVWSSEARGSEAAFFDFLGGIRYWYPQSKTIDYRALPVRSGK